MRDHGLTVGDGVFETMKVVDGGAVRARPGTWPGCAARPRGSGCNAPDGGRLRARGARELLAAHDPGEVGRLRITLTGGDGPPGTERGDAGPTVLMVAGPARHVDGAAVLRDRARGSRNERSAVAGAKTTSYAENVVALAWARERGADEALFADTRGKLCEGTGSNVFLVPRAAGAHAGAVHRLPGRGDPRAGRASGAAPRGGGAAVRARSTRDEVFLTSSTRDVQPVRAVDGRTYPAPGSGDRQAAAEFAERSAKRPIPTPLVAAVRPRRAAARRARRGRGARPRVPAGTSANVRSRNSATSSCAPNSSAWPSGEHRDRQTTAAPRDDGRPDADVALAGWAVRPSASRSRETTHSTAGDALGAQRHVTANGSAGS